MDRRIAKMAALGRHFEVGNLYNYRNDIVIPGKNFVIGFVNFSCIDNLHSLGLGVLKSKLIRMLFLNVCQVVIYFFLLLHNVSPLTSNVNLIAYLGY